jgi:hypothetical protein
MWFMNQSDTKKALGRAPWQQPHETLILPDSVACSPIAVGGWQIQKPLHRGRIQMVVAQGLRRLSGQATLQDGHQFIVLLYQRWISIDIDHVDAVTIAHQRHERLQHVVAQVAP